MLKRLILLFVIATSTCTINAQVKTNFNNPEKIDAKGKFKKNYAVAVFELAAPDLTKALAREKAEVESGSKIFYIAEPVSVNIDVSKLASWVNDIRYSNGKFTLKSKGAKTLSINFSNFTLPKGTEMYIYNKDAEMITGVITEAENNEAKVWGSSIYKGDEINIEIKVPLEEKEKLSLQITNVAYGYKNIFIEKVAGFGLSGACNINVLCPAGNNWVAERNSVVYIAHADGRALCSGAMLMNTCASNIPYVLTANHCFANDNNVTGWRVHFQAWSPTCPNPGTNSDGILFNGSTLRANWAPSDFCLVQLNQTPAANSGIHYAGWSRATTAATSGVSIHHPRGDVMKISTYTTPLIREDNPARCNVNPVGELQWVVQWNEGVTEPGSSGSPLFDQNRRIVGQLSGGPSSCAQPANCRIDMYGRFDNSWTGGGTSATRLSNWLDPGNTGAITTNTTNISGLGAPTTPTLSITGASEFCTGSSNYTLNGAPAGSIINWQTSNGSIGSIPPPPYGSTVTVTKQGNGTITLTATIAGSCNKATKTIKIGATNYSFSVSGPSSACPNQTQYYSTNAPVGNITWSWPSGWTYQSGQNSTLLTIITGNTSGSVSVSVPNTCGAPPSTASTYTQIDASNCGFGITATPNPTTDNVTIAVAESKNVASANKKKAMMYQVKVSDQFGTVKKQYKYSSGTSNTIISLRGLISGMYTIQAFDGRSWSSVKVIKQ